MNHPLRLSLLLLTLLGACKGAPAPAGSQATGASSTTASSSPSPSASHATADAAPGTTASAARPASAAGCFVASAKGEFRAFDRPPSSKPEAPPAAKSATDAGATTPKAGTSLEPRAWLTLDAGSEVTFRHPRTTRETTYGGPAVASPCLAPLIEVGALLSGTFRSEGAAGIAPGNEQWVVTPNFVARYSDAALTVAADLRGGSVRVVRGEALVWTAGDVPAGSHTKRKGGVDAGLDEGTWSQLRGGEAFVVQIPPSPPSVARATSELDQCDALEKAAEAATTAIRPGRGFEDLVARSVRAQREARAACLVAAIRVDALPPDQALALAPRREAAARAWDLSLTSGHGDRH